MSLSLPLIIPFPGQTAFVCLVVSCMEDISYHLAFFLHFLRQVNQNKTQHLLCICTREITWKHDCIFYFGVAGFFFLFLIISKHLICSVFLLFCPSWAVGWHHYRAVLKLTSLSCFRPHHFACKFKGVSPSQTLPFV